MNVLILFEESQAVCKAFRRMGHRAFSCDLKECSGGHPEWHLQMDVELAIDYDEWDFIGMHPVCKSMTVSGNKHYSYGKEGWPERIQTVNWTVKLWEKVKTKCKMAYIENPIGAMNSDERLPKPQIIQPYFFGDPFQKTTCLWLYNLPPLFHANQPDLFNDVVTHVEKGEFITTPSGAKLPKWYSDAKSKKNYSEIRSKTFPGTANAMADQWGIIQITNL